MYLRDDVRTHAGEYPKRTPWPGRDLRQVGHELDVHISDGISRWDFQQDNFKLFPTKRKRCTFARMGMTGMTSDRWAMNLTSMSLMRCGDTCAQAHAGESTVVCGLLYCTLEL